MQIMRDPTDFQLHVLNQDGRAEKEAAQLGELVRLRAEEMARRYPLRRTQ